MGEAGLILWIIVFVEASTGVSLLLASIIIFIYGLVRHSQKTFWLGVFMSSVAAVLLATPVWIWLATFHPAVRAGAAMKIVRGVGLSFMAFSFAAFIRCAWKERRWDLV